MRCVGTWMVSRRMERASWGAPPSCFVAAKPSRMRAERTSDSGRLMPAENSMLLPTVAACTPAHSPSSEMRIGHST